MSISFVEFKKLLHPAIPEKFKLIYEILYYYKIDIDELLNLTADRVIFDNSNDELRQGILLTTNKFIELPTELFERLTKYLDFNGKKWGMNNSRLVHNELNFVFESNKKGHSYTIPTLYKKFKEHCLKVGILRDLALGSLINTDLGRFISIINSELDQLNENLIITAFSFDIDEISSLLRYFIVHMNYEEITNYSKENTDFGSKENFSYTHVFLTVFTTKKDISLDIFIQEGIKSSKAIFVAGKPTSANRNSFIDLLSRVHKESYNKFVSFVIDDPAQILQAEIDVILQSSFRPWVQYVPLHLRETQNIQLLTLLEDFFIFLLEKLNSIESEGIELETKSGEL